MSTEQSESAHSQDETQTADSQVDITRQATTPTATTTTQRAKNPKRVAAGKLVAERTRLAREQQKKAAAEAAIIIATTRRKPPPRPLSQPRLQKTKAQSVAEKKIAVSAPPNGLLLAA